MATLTILEGPEIGKTFALTQDTTRIGRNAANDFVINNPSVSSEHCLIEHGANGFRIKDLDSTNGTRLNGERIEMASIFRNDVLTLGDIPLSITGDDVPENIDPVQVTSNIPRTTIVIQPAQAKTIENQAFAKRSDFKFFWVLMVVVAIAVIALLLYFINVFYLSR